MMHGCNRDSGTRWSGVFVLSGCALFFCAAPGRLGYCQSIAAADAADGDGDKKKIEFFERHIRPLLVEKCYECHSTDTEANGGLLLDSRAGWQRGGDSGSAIEPGNAQASLLIKATEYSDPDLQMPPEGPLPKEAVQLLKEWITSGAIDPRESIVAASKKSSGLPLDRAGEHWAYRPVGSPKIPDALAGDDASNPVDAFLLAQLHSAELPAADPATPRDLIRRLSYDLHGLPPSTELTQAYVDDSAPDAYQRAVDRLLASPRTGERLARRWMDVARYGESLTLRGFVLPQAWRYRDYLITALSEDRPYDIFVAEQIAGDLLTHSDRQRREQQLVATTFLALGNTNLEEQDKQQLEMDYVDEQLDVLGRVFMAQTIGCARCHDHKFDPIPTADYYAMAGILKAAKAFEHDNVSKWIEKPLPVPDDEAAKFDAVDKERQAVVASIARLEKQIAQKPGDQPGGIVALDKIPGIVIDDTAALKVGQWKESRSVLSFVGEGYVHDNKEKNVAKTITFQPKSVPAGTYRVSLSYNAADSRCSKVAVRVFSADGEKLVLVNQRERPQTDGLWQPLGEFRFEKDGQAFVLVSNEDADGFVIVDAVQFLLLDQADTPQTLAKNGDAATSAANGEQTQSDLQEELKRLKSERVRLEKALATRPQFMTIDEVLPASDIRVHVRGNVHNQGAVVPRGFLQCADFEKRSPFPGETSGRRELAEWMTDTRHPLTARVFVNRLWLWTMGQGLVRSVDNFGTTGESPTHPELLDFLAADFMEHEWSPQFTMRRLLLSAAYCRSVQADERAAELDPENRLWSRAERKRLDVESLRDAMLQVSGELHTPGRASTIRPGVKEDYRYPHEPNLRAVYQPVLRNALPELYEAFDFPNPSVSTGQRSESVVSPQALAMLNSPWVHARAAATAQRMLSDLNLMDSPAERPWNEVIDETFLRSVGRAPTQIELYTAVKLVEELEQAQMGREEIVTRLVHGVFASIDFRYLD